MSDEEQQRILMDNPERAEHWQGVCDLAAIIASGSVSLATSGVNSPKVIAKNAVDIALAILDEVGARAAADADPRIKVGDRVRLRGMSKVGEVIEIREVDAGPPSALLRVEDRGACDVSWYSIDNLELVSRTETVRE